MADYFMETGKGWEMGSRIVKVNRELALVGSFVKLVS